MYAYDNEAALSAGAGSRVDTFGAYTGQFTAVEHKESETGSKGINFHFETDDGKTATFYMNIIKKNGDKNPIGYGHLNALMRILKIDGLSNPKSGLIEKGGVQTPVKLFNELANKPIGIMFNTHGEMYNGSETVKLDHAMFFRANDRMSAAEIINKSSAAEDADKVEARLKHTPVSNNSQRQGGGSNVPDDYTPFDDDTF